MLTCPNFSLPLYRTLALLHGKRAVYTVHAYLESASVAHKGVSITEDLVIQYKDGTDPIPVGDLLEWYAPDIGRNVLRNLVRGQGEEGSAAFAVLKRLALKKDATGEVALALLSKADTILQGVTIHLDDTLTTSGVYEYDADQRRIRLSPKAFSEYSDERARQVILHEIVHAITVGALQRGGKFATQMETLYSITAAAFPGEYGSQSVEEFVAEALTNPEFQQKIQTFREGSIWQRIKSIIAEFLGLSTGNPVLDAVLRVDASEALAVDGRGQFYMAEDEGNRAKTEAYERIIRSLNRRISALARESRSEKTDAEKRRLKAEVQIAMDALQKAEEGRLITRAITEANTTLKNLSLEFERQYKAKEISFAFTEQMMDTAIGIEDWVGPLRLLLMNNPTIAEDREGLLTSLDKITTMISIIKSNEKEVAIPLHARRIARYDYRTEREFQTMYEKEFNKENPRKDFRTQEEFTDARTRYVSEKMDTNRETIAAQKRARLAQELRRANKDVSRVSAFLRGAQDIGDDIVAIAKQILDRVADTVRYRFNPIEDHIVGLLKNLSDAKGNPTNHKKLYEDFVETHSKTGKETGYYVSEFRLGEYEAEFARFKEEVMAIEDPVERSAAWGRWMRANYEQPYTDAWYKLLDANSIEQTREYQLVSQQIREIMRAFKDGDGNYLYDEIPNEIWEEVKRLHVARDEMKTKGEGELGKHGEKKPTEVWTKVSAQKKATLSPEDYAAWEALQRNAKGELVSTWTEFVPKDKKKYKNDNFKGPGILKRSKWESTQYKDLMALPESHPSRQFYDYIIGLQDAFDKNRHSGKRLGYKIPRMRKSKIEMLRAGELGIKDTAQQAFSVTEDDTEFGGMASEDSEGNLKNAVPIFFAGKLDPSEMSFDIATVTARNAFHAIDYEEKVKIMPNLRSLSRRMKDREILNYDKMGRPIMLDEDTQHTINGDQSNSFYAFKNLLEKELYGIRKHDQKHVKLIEKVLGANSALLLGGNVRAAISNLTVGQLMANIEMSVSGHVSKKAWARAYAVYMGNIGSTIGDIGKAGKTGKINRIMEEYDGHNDFEGSRYDFATGGKALRLISDGSWIHGLTGTVEHFTGSLSLLAILNDIKVMNADGTYLSVNGGTTTDPNEALSLYEAGELERDHEVVKIRFDGRIWEYGPEVKHRITQKSRGLNKRINGAYSQQNKGEIHRHVWGRAIMSMRNWLFPQWDRRWRGTMDVFSGQNQEIMDWEIQDTFEGHYVTLVKMMKGLYTERESMGLSLAAHWNEMDDKQKANIKKALLEVTAIATTTALFYVLNELAKSGDDDDDQALYFAAYQMLRVRSEFAFFLYPPSMMDIVSDPAASLSTVGNAFELAAQLTNPTEEYESGRNRGELKLKVKAERFIPLWRQVEGLTRSEDFIKYYNM